MVINRRTIYLIALLMGLYSQSLLAQESILKDFAESRHESKYCLYPSTLRMLNLTQDPDFNILIAPIEKALFYQLDSAASGFDEVIDKYLSNGYETYMQMEGGVYDIHVLGKEGSTVEWTGIIVIEQEAFAFYVTGMVNWQKLPALTQTLQENDILNLFDFTRNKNNEWDD
ncbi:MAG: hypothetical protein ACI8QD_002665 [Cyclobacteriaceae bacterium]